MKGFLMGKFLRSGMIKSQDSGLIGQGEKEIKEDSPESALIGTG